MWLYSQHFQICQKRDQQGFDALSATERLNYLVGYLYYQVHNGGVWQYLSNPCGPEAPQLSEALQLIGAPRHAAALDECLSHFPPEGPPQDQSERDEIVDNITDRVANELGTKVSSLVCDEDSVENLLVLLRRAIRDIEKRG
ncbi:DMP19 family protein [Acinetobacter haemolyticus]|uniref:DMP19 family protein n=1 Tax=Acinetobacter haemolyticus TaxID=29430 RepID=UPI00398A9F4E